MEKERFADFENVRLEILQKKAQSGIADFDNSQGRQWTALRFAKPLLITMEKVIKKEIAQKVIKTGTSSQACPNCGSNVSSYYCSVCGQKLSY
jgi:NMD protein affecting ribosome stability and mRNA decay